MKTKKPDKQFQTSGKGWPDREPTTTKIIQNRKNKFLFLTFFFILATNFLQAQTNPLYLTWDYGVGCQSGNNSEDRKSYFELMESGDCLRVCAGSVANYTLNHDDGSWQSVTWNIVGGTATPGTSVCNVRWSSTMTSGSISAIVHTDNGDFTLPPLCIEILPSPKVFFTKAPFDFAGIDDFSIVDSRDPIEACLGESIVFANGSNINGGGLLNYYWDFGDGSSSNAMNPTHTYDNVGTYTVTLTATTECNCQITYAHKVNVGKKSLSIVCPSVVCDGQKATYSLTNQLEGQRCTYDWSVAGGTITSSQPYHQDVEVDWSRFNGVSPDDGFGYVTFTPDQCTADCFAPTTVRVPIIRNKMQITGNQVACAKVQQRYTLPQWPTTDFVWSISTDPGMDASIVITDQRNEILLNPGSVPGFVKLMCEYQNTLLNCGGRSEMKIEVKRSAEITGLPRICLSDPVDYTLPNNLSATWTLIQLPNGTPTIYEGPKYDVPFTHGGLYSLSASGPDFCTEKTFLINVDAPAAPIPTDVVGSRDVCPSKPATFALTNTVPDTIIGWSLPEGVGTIVGSNYGDTVQVIFNTDLPQNTTYQIMVWRESTEGDFCKSEIVTIDLNDVPFNMNLINNPALQVCGSSRHTYTVAETDGDTYIWSLSNPTAGSILVNGLNQVEILWNQFPNLVNVDLQLEIIKCNKKRTLVQTITINDPQISIAGPTTTVCQGDAVTFTVIGNPIFDNQTGAILWDFGDGTSGIGQTVTHQFYQSISSPMNYSVAVSVSHPNGCANTLIAETDVTVNPTPKAHLSEAILVSCSSQMNFTINLIQESGFGTSPTIIWYKDNVAIPNTNQYSYTATTWGSYKAKITNSYGCSYITKPTSIVDCNNCDPNTVLPPVTLTFSEDCGKVTAYGDYGTAPTPSSQSYYAEVLPDSGTNNIFTFHTPGYKQISYVAYYGNCPDGITESILIPYIPNLDYVVNCAQTPGKYEVVITDRSLYDLNVLGNGVSRIFMKGTEILPQQQGESPDSRRIELDADNVYQISITIQGSASGMHACTKTLNFTLPPLPNADFFVGPTVCEGETTHFAIQSQSNVIYNWNFGDGAVNLVQNPDRTFSSSGTKNVTLTVTDEYGCHRSTTKPVIVLKNNQNGSIDDPSFGCPNDPVLLTFTPSQGSIVDNYTWTKDGQEIVNSNSDSFLASETGSYSIIIGNSNGCERKLDLSAPVVIATSIVSDIVGPSFSCEHSAIKLRVIAGNNPGLQYRWFRQDQPQVTLSSTSSVIDTPPGVGDYVYNLVVVYTNGSGTQCTTTYSHTVSVQPSPVLTGVFASISECDPYYKVKLSAYADSQGTFNWSNGQNGNEITVHEGGLYQVTFTNLGGCQVSQVIEAPKSLERYMWIFPTGCYTICDKFLSTMLIGPSIKDFPTWSWQMDDNVVAGNHVDAPVTINPVTNYTLQPLIPSQTNTYNLQLEQEPCALKSGDMTVNVVNCDCEVKNHYEGYTYSETPFRVFHITIHFNGSSTSKTVMVTTPNNIGVITPSSVIVPPQGIDQTFELYPDQNFTGGSFSIDLQSSDGGTKQCLTKLDISVSQPQGRKFEGQLTKEITVSLIPNPVKDYATIQYDLKALSALENTVFTIYDLLGRPLFNYSPKTLVDSFQVDMERFESGNYILVVKKNDEIIVQKNIIIAH